MRIVSLLPSATEIVCAIGAGDLLVGRSHECDHPAQVSPLPALTGQKTAYDPASGVDAAEIDRQVRAQLDQGGSLYTLNAEALRSLQPDLILTQDLCSVCSIDLEAVRRIAADIAPPGGAGPEILSLNPHTIEDVLDDMLRVGQASGREREATDAVVTLRERFQRAQEFVNPYEQGPVVGFLEWTDPLFIAGHWTVQMIERAGGRHPLNETVAGKGQGAAAGMQQGARKAGKSIAVSPEIFCATNPEAIVIAPCGLTLDQATDAARSLALQPWWSRTPAARNGRIAIVDGSQMFNRPGPRLADAFEWLVGWLQGQPQLAPAGFPARAFAG